MAKQFKTLAKDLFSRVNIQAINVDTYCKNNGISEEMRKRLQGFRIFIDTMYDEVQVTLDEAITDYKSYPNYYKGVVE